jgi:hypothetical protein
MQYTLRNVPAAVDALLRRRARDERKSLNEVTLESIMRGLGLTGEPTSQRDLSDIAGTRGLDAETRAALDEQRRVDKDLWR